MPEDTGNFYESGLLQAVTGDTLRPGGFCLTKQAVNSCGFLPGDRVLDLGCGSGATVELLVSQYELCAVGIDPSEVLLQIGKRRNPEIELIRGRGEELPFPKDTFHGVFAECTLSVMNDLDNVLEEVHRVLKPGGWLVINDVYARNSEGLKAFQALNLEACIRRALPKQQVINLITGAGFKLVNWSDHTGLLKQLMVDLIMVHGSMSDFWLKSVACQLTPLVAQSAIKQIKMGYFQLIAQKATLTDSEG